MEKEIKKYQENNLVCFSINITQKQKENGTWRKDIIFPKGWNNFTLDESYYNKQWNCVALSTGKINNIFILDIDNVEQWLKLLKKYNEKEPKTVKAISGSGGIHYYFIYTDDLFEIGSKSKCFGKDDDDKVIDMDIRGDGGCIIVSPSTYFNKNLNKQVKYEWKFSIFDYELIELPKWLKNILIENTTKDNKNIDIIKFEPKIIEIGEEEIQHNFSSLEIETLVKMLSFERCNNYNDWLNVGMCLYNVDIKNLLIWMKWSQISPNYENGICEKKWNSFKKIKDGFKIGSLLLWCKTDNIKKYEDFMKEKKLNNLIITKYPNDNLNLGNVINVNNICKIIPIKNNFCLIKCGIHTDMPDSMFVEIVNNTMTMKCRHFDCFGKTHPCDHIIMNKNEMNNIFNQNITINNIYNGQDNELVEFQKIDIYDDPKINELIFNSLNGEAYSLAEVIYYFYENDFMYAENDDWYIFLEHKWKNIGKKNLNLRNCIKPTLKNLYSQLVKYLKSNDNDKNKLNPLKQIIKSFDNTNIKNNIITELAEIYTIKKNPKRDFLEKLNVNKYLICFTNGVLELKTLIFRDGKPEDYVSMSVGYDYSPTHSNKHNDLIKFLNDIQPTKEELEYLLTYLATGLIGNLFRYFTIFTGCGCNGKSKFVELIAKTFGDYFGSTASQLFTRPRPDASAPDPGLLNLKDKKIVISSEPEKNCKLNCGFIKFITGKDIMPLRECHSNVIKNFMGDFLTFFLCNDIPDCDEIDIAISKRFRCVNFLTEFCKNPIKSNQRLIDEKIGDNFDFWKMDFMLLLIEHYKKYMETQELIPTENILKWTNQYKENNDIYLQYLNEKTEEIEGERVHCSEMYIIFKDWFKNNNPNTKIPNNKDFVNGIRKHKDVKKIYVNNSSQLGIENLNILEN